MTVPILGGRPMKYTPEDFANKINEYFEFIKDENQKRRAKRFTEEKFKPYTLTGICVYLGISRETWREYERREEYADIVKTAKVIVENYVEEGVLNGTVNPIGGIFNLKNNFGWVDKTEVSVNANAEKLSDDDIDKAIKERKKLEVNAIRMIGDGEG